MLVAASKRHLIIVDGMPACAALMVASRIAPAVTDYCVYCRSHSHQGLDQALALFHASALLELGIESTDGTGATLAWPLVRSAAALLTEVADGEEPGPTLPAALRDDRPTPAPAASEPRSALPAARVRERARPAPAGCVGGVPSAAPRPAIAAGARLAARRRRHRLRRRHGGFGRWRGRSRRPCHRPQPGSAGRRRRQRRQLEQRRCGAPCAGPIDARAQADRLQHQVVVDRRTDRDRPARGLPSTAISATPSTCRPCRASAR